MYRGSNPTAVQSQHWLADALIQLMEEKPYEQITIQNICKRADLSRQTFYNVFNNKEEVLRFQLRGQYEAQFQRLMNQPSITVDKIVGAFATELAESQTLLRLMIDNGLDSVVSDEITKCVSLFSGQFVRESQKNELFPYAKVLISGALGNLLVYWFRQENPISIEKLNSLITEFLSSRLFSLND